MMTKFVGQVIMSKGNDSIAVKSSKAVFTYQRHMVGVYCGDQHRVMGAGFVNVAHFKKWYKKSYLGLDGFRLLWEFTA